MFVQGIGLAFVITAARPRKISPFFEIAFVVVRLNHFFIAVWRAKETECVA
jgi:hypothetical protein